MLLVSKLKKMKIKLIDENLVGQKGLSRYLDPNTGWERDIDEYDVAIYTDNMGNIKPIDESKINCAWIIEPPIINGENYTKVVNNKQKFRYIFSHIMSLKDKLENFVFIPHGGTWLEEHDIKIHDKNKLISFIFSWKDWNHFHKMRHRIYQKFMNDNRIEFYGSGCNNPVEKKIESLKNYRFSIVVENSVESDYFTEKLLDCFLTGTIPIYLGPKTITEHFDSNGIIFFDDVEELPEIIEKLNNDLYDSKIVSIQKNFENAKRFIHPEKMINNFLKQNLI